MEYSERSCQLCGVRFNVGRLRRADEPVEAGWDCNVYPFITHETAAASCESLSCAIALHEGADDEWDEDGISLDGTMYRLDCEEHIAGPECTSTSGYSGHRISVQEMQHVISCQCLAEKRDGWIPEPGDQDFELEAEHCFLTGIGKGSLHKSTLVRLEPVRHGVSKTVIENDSPIERLIGSKQLGLDTGELCALPMHPRCFELFQRVSLRYFTRVDIDGLWQLREERGSNVNRFEGMPKHSDLELVSEQWYSARPGTEYLAADPVDVPGLSELIESCLPKTGYVCQSIFDPSEHRGDGSTTHSDPFSRLPPELQHVLLGRLSRRDVANLRLVSPAFKQLPQIYFRHLVETEMPWLWEISDLPKHQIDFYRVWCRLHEADGGSQLDLHERQWLEQMPKRKRSALLDELESKGISASSPLPPKSLPKFDKWASKLKEEAEAEVQAGSENGMWQRKPANVLLGLRNRRRIWQDLEVIVQMISELDLTNDEE